MFYKDKLSGYVIKEKIYESNRTLIYRAYRENDLTPVIIKILNKKFPTRSELDRIKHEYGIASNVTFSGLIRFYDLITVDHTRAIVMEDIGGISLTDYIKKFKPDMQMIISIAGKITSIIGQLHRRSLIHKDVHPGNIIINPDNLEIRIIDFDIAARVVRETGSASSPEMLEGSLHYISPEQTGRMNRSIDLRSDFYSFGATLYFMVTGHPPFRADNAAALIHSHIAVIPERPDKVDSDVPVFVSDIIMKLLSKTAEDRYQSAVGLYHDLEKSHELIVRSHPSESFSPGGSDISETLNIPEKLYGRDSETGILFNEFSRISDGGRGIIFFSGPSGIGKSYLINEIQKPLVHKKGYFISGKFDHLKKEIPYYSFVKAFQNLAGEILIGSEESVKAWKKTILSAIGESANVITEILPELELIIGKQKPVPELNPEESRNRFLHVLKKFIGSIAHKEHPLVMFIDDLQWADSASIKLLNEILTESELEHFLFIGAYRENCNMTGSPLDSLFEIFNKDAVLYRHMKLTPLSVEDINRLVSDTLFRNDEMTIGLSSLIKSKTDGNPFFVKEFILNLYRSGLIYFNEIWKFDIEKIHEANITDNVLLMMSDRIKNLNDDTAEILKTASCIGMTFNLDMLSKVTALEADEVFEHLRITVNDGMLIKSEENFRFAHDRIRDAVYSQIDSDTAARIHYSIGKKILQLADDNKIDELIFKLTFQLNHATSLISDQDEKIRLAEFNLSAGLKSKASTAYDASLVYFLKGIELLPADSWESNYDLTLALYTEAGESGYLSGNYRIPEIYFKNVLLNARSILDKLKVYEIEIAINTSQQNLQKALECGMEALKLLKVKMPSKATRLNIFLEFLSIRFKLMNREIEDLINMPEITDPYNLAVIRILMRCTEPAYIGTPDYFPIISLKLMNFTLKYGNSMFGTYSYMSYGNLISAAFNKFTESYKFGILGIKALEKFNPHFMKCRIYFVFATMINHWKNHISGDLPFLIDGYHIGIEMGDLAFASYCLNHQGFHYFFMGSSLNDVRDYYSKYMQASLATRQILAIEIFRLYYQLVLNLTDSSFSGFTITGDIFDEERIVPIWLQQNNINGYNCYLIAKIILSYMSGNYDTAADIAIEGEHTLNGILGMNIFPQFYFYYSLSLTADYENCAISRKELYMKILKQNVKKLKEWAGHSPDNYKNKLVLIKAEIARIAGNNEKAVKLYQEAIELSFKNRFLHEEAISSELAAKFFLSLGMSKYGSNYIIRAYNCYKQWGGELKIKMLVKNHGDIIK